MSRTDSDDTKRGPEWPNRDDRPSEESSDNSWLRRVRFRFLRRAKRHFLHVLLDRGICWLDDVRATVPVPDGVNPACCGAIPTDFHRGGLIARIGDTPTERPVAHRRWLSVWRLVDADAARRWLATHPDLPPEDEPPATPARVSPRGPRTDPQRLLFTTSDAEQGGRTHV